MKKQEYLDLRKRHEKELKDFPIAYAFNDKQLEEALEKLGATSRDECVTVFGHGDIVKRENAKPLINMFKRHTEELHQKLKVDHEFAEAAFLYEMDNHEYAINMSGNEDVLDSLSLSSDKILKWGLYDAYRRAQARHMEHAKEWGVL